MHHHGAKGMSRGMDHLSGETELAQVPRISRQQVWFSTRVLPHPAGKSSAQSHQYFGLPPGTGGKGAALVGAIYTTPGWPANGWIPDGAYYIGTLNLSSFSWALAGIISALIFGALTGFLWGRFRGKELTEKRKGRSVLLVSFIMGGVIWLLLAVVFLVGVAIIREVPAIEPGFWWFDLLCRLVVFLGLPGWVLALVAWRKTKRDESGLKLGVAGGVIMAVTGIMLLPGLLAITGGVFSGRKPATEPSTAAIEQ